MREGRERKASTVQRKGWQGALLKKAHPCRVGPKLHRTEGTAKERGNKSREGKEKEKRRRREGEESERRKEERKRTDRRRNPAPGQMVGMPLCTKGDSPTLAVGPCARRARGRKR